MNEEKDMRMLIEEDLRHSQEIWESYSHDKEKLGELFQLLLQHYDGEIDGFDEDLWVIQDREDCADMAEVYRKNIRHLMERLEAFRDNGYSNEGLMEYYIRKEQKDIDYSADFTSVRISLGMANLPAREKEEIMMKLDEMEEICARWFPEAKSGNPSGNTSSGFPAKKPMLPWKFCPCFSALTILSQRGRKYDQTHCVRYGRYVIER